jgi:outer membrane protein assembly factor BamB
MYRPRRPSTILAALLFLPTVLLTPLLRGETRGRGIPEEAEAGWRSDWTGTYTRAAPPTTWSAAEPILWKLELSQWSNATPVIHRNRVFFCEEPSTLVAADLEDGGVLWRRDVDYEELNPSAGKTDAPSPQDRARQLKQEMKAAADKARILNQQLRADRQNQQLREQVRSAQREIGALRTEQRQLQAQRRRTGKPVTHATNGYSSPTPVAAGERVFVLFGYGGAASFDLDGNRIWARMVERSANGWGHSASPVLTGGKLILHINKTVHALDPGTGEELWATPSNSTWGTPLPLSVGGESAVLTTGGDLIRVRDGKIVAAKIGAMPWTSPIAHEGVIYIVDQRGAFAYRVPEKLDDRTGVEKLRQSKPPSDRYYATPVVHDGLLFAINQRGTYSVIDIADGTVVATKKLKLRGTMYPSIALAGGKLFVSDDQGTTLVLEPGREYVELASNSLEPFRGTPVFAGGRIYIRTLKNLYCIGTD